MVDKCDCFPACNSLRCYNLLNKSLLDWGKALHLHNWCNCFPQVLCSFHKSRDIACRFYQHYPGTDDYQCKSFNKSDRPGEINLSCSWYNKYYFPNIYGKKYRSFDHNCGSPTIIHQCTYHIWLLHHGIISKDFGKLSQWYNRLQSNLSLLCKSHMYSKCYGRFGTDSSIIVPLFQCTLLQKEGN